jgi:hypothetical protein
METTSIYISEIRRDGGTQPRQALEQLKVDEYAELMGEGVEFPPLDVMYDGMAYYLVDGFHRAAAAEAQGLESLECRVHQGTLEDARWMSLAANATHGLPRTGADKRRAVRLAIQMRGAELSDRAIAEHVRVDHKTVGAVRREMEAAGEIPQITSRTGRDGRVMETGGINAARSAEGVGDAPVWPVANEFGVYRDPEGVAGTFRFTTRSPGCYAEVEAIQVGPEKWAVGWGAWPPGTGEGHPMRCPDGEQLVSWSAALRWASEKIARVLVRAHLYATMEGHKRLIDELLAEVETKGGVIVHAVWASVRDEMAESIDQACEAAQVEAGERRLVEYPQPNEDGEFADGAEGVEEIIGDGGASAIAVIRVLDISPAWWACGFSVSVTSGGEAEPLRNRYKRTRDEAVAEMAQQIAEWLDEHERGMERSKNVQRQIAKLRAWAVEQGADLEKLEKERQRAIVERKNELRNSALDLMESLGMVLSPLYSAPRGVQSREEWGEVEEAVRQLIVESEEDGDVLDEEPVENFALIVERVASLGKVVKAAMRERSKNVA